MIITEIEPFNRGKDRMSIYCDNEFAFVLYKGELSKYGIKVGNTISDDIYEEILTTILIPRAKKRGLNLLQKMDRTEADVRNKLLEGGYPVAVVDVAIEYIKSFKYIDDNRYASDYVRFKSSSMSRKKIEQQLLQKGISKSIIDNVYNELEENGLEEGNIEDELIERLMLKKLKNNCIELDYVSKNKLFSYLYNKGFNIGDIERAYKRIINSNY